MQIKSSVKIGGLVLVMGFATLLTACSRHSNPLKTASPDVTAKFLVRASQSAEKKIHVFKSPGGNYYGECMDGKKKQALCNKLYQAMASYASHTKMFNGVTVNDLTNQHVYGSLEDYYKGVLFSTI